MKLILFLMLACIIFLASCTPDIASEIPKEDIKPQKFSGKGTVITVNKENGEVSIKHEEIKGLMSAMTMTFKATDRKIVSGLSVNDKVEFELARKGAELTLLSVSVDSNPAPGQMIYKTNCAKCHGDKGEGKEKGITLIEGHALEHSNEEFLKQVKEGGEKMPAFGEKLSEDEIKSVVSYVRENIQAAALEQKKNQPDVGHKH